MAPVASTVLLEPILDGQLRAHSSDAASILFGPNSCTEHVLLLTGFELSFFLEARQVLTSFYHRFGLGLIKLRFSYNYLWLTCLKPLPTTFIQALKRVGLPGAYCHLYFTPPLLDLCFVSIWPKANSMYVAQ